MRSTAALALAGLVATLPACLNSSYIPRSPGRIAMIMQGGAQVYVRDGQIYQHGFLGSGLMRAVRGNRAAERAAREYHDRQKDGLLLGLGGMICSVVAAAKMGADLAAQEESEDNANDVPTAALVSVGCMIASMAGLGYAISAEPYRYDAINIFNDTNPTWTPGAPGQLGQVERARPSLRMPQ